MSLGFSILSFEMNLSPFDKFTVWKFRNFETVFWDDFETFIALGDIILRTSALTSAHAKETMRNTGNENNEEMRTMRNNGNMKISD